MPLALKDAANVALLDDAETMARLEATLTPTDVKADAYDAILFAGGMGTMWDFAEDARLGTLAAELYEQGKVSHCGVFNALEDQMCAMTGAGYVGEGSPDRADALVWALTELMLKRRTEPRVVMA